MARSVLSTPGEGLAIETLRTFLRGLRGYSTSLSIGQDSMCRRKVGEVIMRRV
jgi:hypothetical protein